jgi:hypothetical protein
VRPLRPRKVPLDRRLLLLLLPAMLERLPEREAVEEVLRAPDAVAVEPPRVSYDALARLPMGGARSVARRQAWRMRLPGVPAVVIVLHPLQFPLGAAMADRFPVLELWYAPPGAEPASPREADLHAAASERALETVALPLSARLWTRAEALGIESGRLGSERLLP